MGEKGSNVGSADGNRGRSSRWDVGFAENSPERSVCSKDFHLQQERKKILWKPPHFLSRIDIFLFEVFPGRSTQGKGDDTAQFAHLSYTAEELRGGGPCIDSGGRDRDTIPQLLSQLSNTSLTILFFPKSPDRASQSAPAPWAAQGPHPASLGAGGGRASIGLAQEGDPTPSPPARAGCRAQTLQAGNSCLMLPKSCRSPLQAVLRARSCPISSSKPRLSTSNKEREKTQSLLIIPDFYKNPWPQLSIPVAEIQGWDVLHLPAACSTVICAQAQL